MKLILIVFSGWLAGNALAARESVLRIDYDVHCTSRASFPGLVGTVTSGARHFRVELFAATHETRVALGPVEKSAANARLEIAPSSECTLDHLSTSEAGDTVDSLPPRARLAWRHSPFLVVRDDQYADSFTDIPIALADSWLIDTAQGTATLRYTMFFTDEDTKTGVSATSGQMARYGRVGDIEWVYEVVFSRTELAQYEAGQRALGDLHPLARHHQAPIFRDVGHRTADFKGRFVEGSEHPILYDWAKHNVFGDTPWGANQARHPVAHALVPLEEIVAPEAREQTLFRHPWTLEVSDAEMTREKKLALPFTDYLYVLVDGALEGQTRGEVSLDSGEKAQSGGGYSSIDRLGEDLFGESSFTAIPLGRGALDRIGEANRGHFRFLDAGWGRSKVTLSSPLRFFRFRGEPGQAPKLEDITRYFAS